MRIHILGICGTFMGGLALLAKEKGFAVSGSDQNVYPPMSTQLEQSGIKLYSGYDINNIADDEIVIVGNVMTRGMPIIEQLLNDGRSIFSGPQFLADHILKDRWVLAVSGTHGKTTTTALLTWILEHAGLQPGFLIGGVTKNFNASARLGGGDYFVVEADEYDSAFFDKRSKFIHYHPRTLIINNIEFDHADIFRDLTAIKQQFHHLIRSVPGNGLIVYNQEDNNIKDTLQMGCWTPTIGFGEQTQLAALENTLVGKHNVMNALAAIEAAAHVGVTRETAMAAIQSFAGVKRRMEIIAEINGITIYDDFAHHPTAIASTLTGLRSKVGAHKRIIACVDFRSNTMRSGHHQRALAPALAKSDEVFFYCDSNLDWDIETEWRASHKPGAVCYQGDALVSALLATLKEDDQLLFMSNGAIGAIQQQLLSKLSITESA